MTLNELLTYLGSHSSYPILDGNADATVEKARAGTHRDPLMGRIVAQLAQAAGATESAITRAQATTALGPIRLEYMKDDAPVEGFRTVERIIHALDSAFNDEAWREKQAGR